MPKANLNSNNSLSSSIASLIFEATGVKEIVRDTVVAPAMREALASSYKRRLSKETAKDDMWAPISGAFNVNIPNNETVVITAGNSAEESILAEELEFGTPDNPPRPVMRPYQETFKQDLMFTMDNVHKSIEI